MRIGASGLVPRPPVSRPTAVQRVLLFVLGAALGGAIGYGLLTTRPDGAPAFFSQDAAPWVLIPGAIVGVLAALFPDAVFSRPGGRFRWYHDDGEE